MFLGERYQSNESNKGIYIAHRILIIFTNVYIKLKDIKKNRKIKIYTRYILVGIQGGYKNMPKVFFEQNE